MHRLDYKYVATRVSAADGSAYSDYIVTARPTSAYSRGAAYRATGRSGDVVDVNNPTTTVVSGSRLHADILAAVDRLIAAETAAEVTFFRPRHAATFPAVRYTGDNDQELFEWLDVTTWAQGRVPGKYFSATLITGETVSAFIGDMVSLLDAGVAVYRETDFDSRFDQVAAPFTPVPPSPLSEIAPSDRDALRGTWCQSVPDAEPFRGILRSSGEHSCTIFDPARGLDKRVDVDDVLVCTDIPRAWNADGSLPSLP